MKSKKILTILLSLAIMFTFMPAMAFAETTETTADWTWDPNMTVATSSAGVKVDLVKTWTAEGYITVTADKTKWGDAPDVPARYYVDLAGAKLVDDAGNALAASYNSGFDPSAKVTKVLVKVPDGVTVPSTITDAQKTHLFTFDELHTFNNGWSGSVEVTPNTYVATKKVTEDQPITVSLKQDWTSTAKGTDTEGDGIIKNAPDTASVTVLAAAASADDAAFYFDMVDDTEGFKNGDMTRAYDGAEHTIVMKNVKGYTPYYQVFNANGVWEDTKEVKISKVLTAPMKVKVTVKDDATGKKYTEYNLNVNLNKVDAPTFAFVKQFTTTVTYRISENTELKGKDFIVVDAPDASAKAAKADEAKWLELFDDYYEITATPGKIDADQIELSFAPKKLSNAEKTALEEKYKELTANYQKFDTQKTYTKTVTGQLVQIVRSNDYEVTFTKASGKTIHVKKAKKTKKAVKFSVAAEAANGATVKYVKKSGNAKISIDSATGEITVKKGLKKGTYKVKIKAYVPGHQDVADGNGYAFATIKVKVKK